MKGKRIYTAAGVRYTFGNFGRVEMIKPQTLGAFVEAMADQQDTDTAATIRAKCNPQEVYFYLYNQTEAFLSDDEEAAELVRSVWGYDIEADLWRVYEPETKAENRADRLRRFGLPAKFTTGEPLPLAVCFRRFADGQAIAICSKEKAEAVEGIDRGQVVYFMLRGLWGVCPAYFADELPHASQVEAEPLRAYLEAKGHRLEIID